MKLRWEIVVRRRTRAGSAAACRRRRISEGKHILGDMILGNMEEERPLMLLNITII